MAQGQHAAAAADVDAFAAADVDDVVIIDVSCDAVIIDVLADALCTSLSYNGSTSKRMFN